MSRSMTGDYRSLAEAVDGPAGSPGWVPGEDFDPADPDGMEIMALVFEAERRTALTRLTQENEYLRRRVAELTEEEHTP